tara:strand:- start:39 stop:299 length:261 start_codon:yes stop_codon:yes gene_type:complete
MQSLKVIFVLLAMTVCAVAFHEHTYAVWELREELQMLYINMWELLYQLEYVTADQRPVVYEEIQHIQSEIQRVISELLQHDRSQHP